MSDKIENYWFKVLRHYEKKGYFHNGLTVPFLIGSRTIVEPLNKLYTVEQFISEVNDKSAPKQVTVMKCGDIGEYVFGLLDLETKSIIVNNKSLFKSFDNLIAIDSSFDGCKNVTEVAEILHREYSDLISDGQYSKEQGVWGPFSEKDTSRLGEIL